MMQQIPNVIKRYMANHTWLAVDQALASRKETKSTRDLYEQVLQAEQGKAGRAFRGSKRPKDCVRSLIKPAKKAKSSLIIDLPIKLIEVNFTVL